MTTPASASKPPILRCLSNGKYALMEGGFFPNYATGWMQRVGAGWLAWELSESPVWLGVIAAADLAPTLVLAPIAGAFTDRVNPLRVIRIAQLGLWLQACAMAFFAFMGWMTIEILFALTFIVGLIYPFHSSARQSIIPATVPREDFPSAIALDSASYHSNRFIGPALAALVIPTWGVFGCFLAHALGTLLCLIALLLLRLPPPDRSGVRRGAFFADVLEGLSYAKNHAGLLPLLCMLTAASLFARPLQDMLPGFAGAVFEGGAQSLAWLTSSIGIGAMCGAVFIATRGRLSGLTTVAFMGFGGLSLATLGFTATNHLWVAVICGAASGFAINVMSTSTQTLMQHAVDDRMRGRVMSLYMLIFRGMPALGALAAGLAGDAFGLRPTFAAGACVSLGVLIFLLPRRQVMIGELEHAAQARGRSGA
jgi:MFS family permease